MLTLEQFKNYIEELTKFGDKFKKATEILINENVGFIDVHFPICSKYIELLSIAMKDDGEWIEWFMFEYADINDDKKVEADNIEYNIKTIDDLYYLLTKQYDKITRWKDE